MSPRARLMWAAVGLIEVLILLGSPQLFWARIHDWQHAWSLPMAIASGVVAAAYLVGMPAWRYRVHRWEATPTAVYTQSGWLSQERRIAPLSRIQTVDVRRGPVAQLFRLASVRVTTASAAGALEIHGLESADADRLAEQLTAAAAAERGDAT